MKTRGRTSLAALSVVSGGVIEPVARPKPPGELTEEQAAVWREVVDRLPADWFQAETFPLLAQYCRHVVSARRVQQVVATIEAEEDFDIAEYDRALKMQERESRCIASLATKMRIAQQSTYDQSKKKGSGGVAKPWQG